MVGLWRRVPGPLTTPHRAGSQASVASRRLSSRKRASALDTSSSSESGGRSTSRRRRRISQATACCSSPDIRSKVSRRCCVAVVMSYTPAPGDIGLRHLCRNDPRILGEMQGVKLILIPEACTERDAERHASGAAESGSEGRADAVSRRLHACVRHGMYVGCCADPRHSTHHPYRLHTPTPGTWYALPLSRFGAIGLPRYGRNTCRTYHGSTAMLTSCSVPSNNGRSSGTVMRN